MVASATPPALLAAPRPSRGLARSVVGAAAVVTVLQALEAVVALRLGDRFLSAVRNGGDAEATLVPYDLLGGAIALVQLGAVVLTGFWLLHLRRFAEGVNPSFVHNRRRWWAFGGWVIPLACLAVPFQYVSDLRGSLRQELARRSVPVGAWWTFLLLNELVDRAVPGRLGSLEAEQVPDIGVVETAQLAFCVPALVLWFLVVKRLSDAAHAVPEDSLRSVVVT